MLQKNSLDTQGGEYKKGKNESKIKKGITIQP